MRCKISIEVISLFATRSGNTPAILIELAKAITADLSVFLRLKLNMLSTETNFRKDKYTFSVAR